MSCETVIHKSDSKFIKEKSDVLFEMYQRSYGDAGEKLWFRTKEDMFKYPCSVVLNCQDKDVMSFVMFQQRKHANKISLLVHNSTPEGKKYLINTTVSLLSMRGWVLEASGAVSWIMRKNKVNVITSHKTIKRVLDLSDDERIDINEDFDITDKKSYHYLHQYMKDGYVMFENKETLFGIGGCNYSKHGCDRKCDM
jgi:hypothetical protein